MLLIRYAAAAALTVLALIGAQPAYAQFDTTYLRLSKSQEREVAQDMLEDLRDRPGIVRRGTEVDFVREIGRRLVRQSPTLDEYEYEFFVLDDNEINAFATPGGYIYVSEGFLDYFAYDPSMVAAVLAHEIAHAEYGHVTSGYQRIIGDNDFGFGILGILINGNEVAYPNVSGRVGDVEVLRFDRDQEQRADRVAVEAAYNAGFDPYGLMRAFQIFDVLEGADDDFAEWYSNHPAGSNRVNRAARIAGNLSGREHGYMLVPRPARGHPVRELFGNYWPYDEFYYEDDDDDDSSSEYYQRRDRDRGRDRGRGRGYGPWR